MGTVSKSFRYQFCKGDFVADDIEVDATIDFTYDRGYWRNRNGDGCPPSLVIDDVVIDTSDEDILAQLTEQWDEEGEFPITLADVGEWAKVIAERIADDVEFDWDDYR